MRYCSSSKAKTSAAANHFITSTSWPDREGVAASVARLRSQRLLDSQQLIVLGNPVRAGHRTGLDLRRGGGHGDVGDRSVLRLARTVRNDRGIVRLVGHVDGRQGLGE